MKIVCSLETRSSTLGKAPTCDATAVESISGVRCNKFLTNPCQKFGYALLEIQPSASAKVKGGHQCSWLLVLLFAQLRVAKTPRGLSLLLDYERRPPFSRLARPPRVILSNR